MIKRGTKYAEEMRELKELRAKMILDKKYTEKYKAKMKGICEAYSISEKTIYRDIHKKIPGLRKRRSDEGKERVSPDKRESVIILEAMRAGKTLEEARKISELKTKKKMSYVKAKKTKIEETESVKESAFGSEFKKFIEKHFDMEMITTGEVTVKLGNYKFAIKKDDMNDIVLILINAYNRWQKHNELDLPLDRELLREQMLMHLFEEQIRAVSEVGDIKSIEMLTRIYDRMKPQYELNTDFAIFEKCIRQLKPGITKEEIIGMIKNNSQ